MQFSKKKLLSLIQENLNEMPMDFDSQDRPDQGVQDDLAAGETPLQKIPFPETGDEPNKNFQELLASERYRQVVAKMRQYTGTNATIRGTQGMSPLMQQMMSAHNQILQFEQNHRRELEQLAVELVMKELGIPEGSVQYDARIIGMGEFNPEDFNHDEEEGGGQENQEDDGVETFYGNGLIFPILLHELVKGFAAIPTREQWRGMDPGKAQDVMGQTDVFSNEPMQLRIGPEIVEKIRFALPDDIFDPEYKGLINFFHVLLYQIEAKEFLEIIGNAISEDSSKLAKAKKRFEELVREAKQMKEEFENYKEEEDIDSDDDEGLDDFLSGLGISRPK